MSSSSHPPSSSSFPMSSPRGENWNNNNDDDAGIRMSQEERDAYEQQQQRQQQVRKKRRARRARPQQVGAVTLNDVGKQTTATKQNEEKENGTTAKTFRKPEADDPLPSLGKPGVNISHPSLLDPNFSSLSVRQQEELLLRQQVKEEHEQARVERQEQIRQKKLHQQRLLQLKQQRLQQHETQKKLFSSPSTLLQQQEEEDRETQQRDADDDPMEQSSLINRNIVMPAPKAMPTRLQQVFTTTDWWSLWIGMISFGFASALVFIIPFNADLDAEMSLRGVPTARYIIPQPMTWDVNPFDAWTLYGAAGTVILLTLMGGLYIASLYCMKKLTSENSNQYILGFALHGLVALLAFWLGRQSWLSRNGLGYAIWSIVFGIILGNLLPKSLLDFLKPTYKDGEFFIKCSLVLLAVEFRVLSRVGLPALLVSWVGSPIVLISSYLIGIRFLGMPRQSAILIVTGATWCGASAISAVGSVTKASSRDIALSISIVAAFTVIFTFAQAYFAMAVGMDHMIAGAWIGASVDQTGNVIASAAILSEEATEVAGIVKIVLNSGLGVLASIVACWWSAVEAKEEREKEEEEQRRLQRQDEEQREASSSESDESSNDPKEKQSKSSKSSTSPFSLLFLWDKFPKFVLGYFLCTVILSLALPTVRGTPQEVAYTRGIQSLNRWWFAIAFVGIGLGTNLKELWHGARKSGILQLYLIANTLDILVALGLAYPVFRNTGENNAVENI